MKLSFDRGTLVVPSEHLPQNLLDAAPWRFDARSGEMRCYAINYRRIAGSCVALMEDAVAEWQALRFPSTGKLPPCRDYQTEAVEAWMRERCGCVVMPTGTGKTRVALEIMRQLCCSTLVVAPLRPLMYQWHQNIKDAFGMDSGVIGDNLFDLRPISVTTYKSACIHMETLGNRFQLIVFDECHHLPAGTFADAARMCAAPWRLGLTATPDCSDGRGDMLDELVGPTVYRLPIDRVKGEALADYQIIKMPVELTAGERLRYDELGSTIREYIAVRSRDDPAFDWKDVCKDSGADLGARRALRANRERHAMEARAEEKLDILEEIFCTHVGVQTLVFTGTNEMARRVSTRFLIPCILSHCGKVERAYILNGFRSGKYRAIVANQVLDEGVDVPGAKVGVILGSLANPRQAVQRLGRILRKSGDASAYLYEVVCKKTGDVARSRKRRKSDAYKGTRHMRIS
jgi:superfamily II DNA or RNA helicase